MNLKLAYEFKEGEWVLDTINSTVRQIESITCEIYVNSSELLFEDFYYAYLNDVKYLDDNRVLFKNPGESEKEGELSDIRVEFSDNAITSSITVSIKEIRKIDPEVAELLSI